MTLQPLRRKPEAEQGLWKAWAVLRCLICCSCSHFHLLPPENHQGQGAEALVENSRYGVRNSEQSRTELSIQQARR